MRPASVAFLHANVEQILQKYQDIFEVGIIQGKSKEILSVESSIIEMNIVSIIRCCEDLLSVTRTLKEKWSTESMKLENDRGEDSTFDTLREKYVSMIDLIASGRNEVLD